MVDRLVMPKRPEGGSGEIEEDFAGGLADVITYALPLIPPASCDTTKTFRVSVMHTNIGMC